MISKWIENLRADQINLDIDWKLENALSSEGEIKDWQTNRLPSDLFSTHNAVIIQNCIKTPLILDAQMQAFNWLKSYL